MPKELYYIVVLKRRIRNPRNGKMITSYQRVQICGETRRIAAKKAKDFSLRSRGWSVTSFEKI